MGIAYRLAPGAAKGFVAGCSAALLATAFPAYAQLAPVADATDAADAEFDAAVSAPTESSINTSTETGATTVSGTADPWEGFNRKMFAVNTALDDAIFTPAAKVYRATTPKEGRRGIRRFLSNLKTPAILINDVLQGEFGRAGKTASRFVINTTIGAGGFADPAAQLGIEGHSEDFGQTLAVWGVNSGPYLVLPFFGPTSVRDTFGAGVQMGMDPFNYFDTPAVNTARYSRTGVGLLSAREPLLEPLAEIRSNSLDYYASVRSFYLQARMREIRNGQTDYSDLPDIGDFEDFEDLE